MASFAKHRSIDEVASARSRLADEAGQGDGKHRAIVQELLSAWAATG